MSTLSITTLSSLDKVQGSSSGKRAIRVLLIVDSLYWGIGNFARKIQDNNPIIEVLIYSQFAIRKTIKRFGHFPESFDLIHYLVAKPLVLRDEEFPTVTTLHHVDSETDLRLLQHGDAVMAVSHQWLQFLQQHGFAPDRLGLVPFGVDTTTFHPPNETERQKIRKTLGFKEHDFIVGFSGKSTSNVDGRKGLTSFIQALKNLHSQTPDVKALLIGPGWQTLVRVLNAQGITCTYFPYQIDHGKIAKWYHAIDIFWVTSTIEGGPVPLLEAMATGIPCVSTPVGAALDLIKNFENGLLVDSDAPDQFANISLQLASSPELRKQIGEQARKTILEQRQWTLVQTEMLKLYDRAIRNFHDHRHQSNPHLNSNEFSLTKNPDTRMQAPKDDDSISPNIRTWIAVCEHLNGVKMLLKLREWRMAMHMTFRAVIIAPFDPHLWSELRKILRKEKCASVFPRKAWEGNRNVSVP